MHTHSEITDTGYTVVIPSPSLPRLTSSDQRALERRVWFMEAEQAARVWKIEQNYLESDRLTLEYLEEQQRLREMRAILLNRGGSA